MSLSGSLSMIQDESKARLLAAVIFGSTLLLGTGPGYCMDAPEDVEKVNLARRFAIEMAIRKNIDLKVETRYTAMAETDAARSRGIYDPILNVSSTGGISYVPGDPFFLTKNMNSSIGLTQYLPIGGSVAVSTQTGFTTAETEFIGSSSTDWQSSVGISLSQPLLKNSGKETMELGINLSANSLQDSLERFRSVHIDTVFAVISAYNHLYSLRKTLESRVAASNSAQSFLDEISKRAKPGPLQRMEIANAEYAIVQRRRDLVEAERSVRDQESSLRYLIGMDFKSEIIPIDAPVRIEPQETYDQALKAALEFRPDLKQLRTALKNSELQERVARHQSLPDLSLTGSGGFSGTGSNFSGSFRKLGDQPSRFWSAGMFFNAPLGNTAAENDYRRSKIRTEQVKDQIKALVWRIQNEIEADLRALISARLQIQMADKSQQFATQRLEEYRKNNRLGTSTVQDVLNAENDLTSARNAHLDATESFAFYVARLWKDMGVLLDREGVQIDTLHSGKITANGN